VALDDRVERRPQPHQASANAQRIELEGEGFVRHAPAPVLRGRVGEGDGKEMNGEKGEIMTGAFPHPSPPPYDGGGG